VCPFPGKRMLEFLTRDDMEAIHLASLKLLEERGVVVKNAEALRILKENGCEVDEAKQVARIPEHIVKECLRKAPSLIRLYSRDGKRDLLIGKDNVIYNPGSTATYLIDRRTGEIRAPTAQDFAEFVRLVDALEHIHAQSTAMIPADVDNSIADLYRLYIVLKNSTKAIVTGAFTKEGLHDMVKMLEIVSGVEAGKRPMAIFDVCPSAPLMWSDIMCQNLVDCAKYKVPAEIVSMPQLGATGPITLAGSLAQLNAEELSAIVISQLTSPGAPIIYGGSPTTFDMRYATPRLGAIETVMLCCAYAQMGKFYGLPTHAYLGLSDSKVPDAQAGLEATTGILLGTMAGVNVISGPGMLVMESCQSFEKLVIDNEICGMALRLARGIEVDADTIALEVMRKVCPGGHYLAEKHTRTWLRKEVFMPSPVIDRLSLDAWRRAGSKDIVARARERVDQILAEHQPEPLPPDVEKELQEHLKAVMAKHGVEKVPLL